MNKNNNTVSLGVALIAFTLVFTTVSSNEAHAYFKKDDLPGHTKLPPKSYGLKTKDVVCGEKICGDNDKNIKSLDGIKKEEIKNYKKVVEKYKALGKWKQAK